MISNCLFEAIKAKLKNPQNVRIIRLPKEISSTAHFMWINKNNVYHAYDYKHSKNHFLFDCKIKSIPYYVFESFILNSLHGRLERALLRGSGGEGEAWRG